LPNLSPRLARSLAAGTLLAVVASAAQAESLSYAGTGYGPRVYAASGYGFAGNAIDGSYIGAPFTRVPSPDRLVPPAWGYGTYGVPTVAGIREAPSARPALYVIERQGRAENRLLPRRSAKVVSRGRDGTWTDAGIGAAERSGAQVVPMRVPGR